MSPFDDSRAANTTQKGMERALAHAADMNRDGRISAEEVKEFMRFVVGETLNTMSMDTYAKARRSPEGSPEAEGLEMMYGAAGYDGDPYEGKKSRETIARKIVADYAGQLWNNSQLDDDGYIGEMEKLGFRGDPSVDGDDMGKRAMMLFQGASGMPAEVADEQEAADSMEIEPEYVAEFQKRNVKRRA